MSGRSWVSPSSLMYPGGGDSVGVKTGVGSKDGVTDIRDTESLMVSELRSTNDTKSSRESVVIEEFIPLLGPTTPVPPVLLPLPRGTKIAGRAVEKNYH